MGAPHTMRTNRMTGLFVVLAMVLVTIFQSAEALTSWEDPAAVVPEAPTEVANASPEMLLEMYKQTQAELKDAQAAKAKASKPADPKVEVFCDKTTSPGCAGAKVVPNDGLNPVKVVTKKAASGKPKKKEWSLESELAEVDEGLDEFNEPEKDKFGFVVKAKVKPTETTELLDAGIDPLLVDDDVEIPRKVHHRHKIVGVDVASSEESFEEKDDLTVGHRRAVDQLY